MSQHAKPMHKRVTGVFTNPAKFFLVFSVFFGALLVFITPPMQVPDEQSHFFQAYAVSDLHFVPKKFEKNGATYYGAELPSSVYMAVNEFLGNVPGNPGINFNIDLYKTYIDQPLDVSVKQYVGGTTYSPIVYIPQAIGITIGKIFNSSPLVMIWLGRLTNLVAWVLILYFAIKILPFAKWAMVVLALNPMTVFLSASLSADVVTVALAFLFFSLIASEFAKKEQVSKKRLLLILATLSLIVLTKPTNILFALLLFAIPWRNFKTKRNFVLFCLGAVMAALTVGLLWYSATSEINQVTAQLQRPGMGISPSEQLDGIINNPLHYAKTILLNYVIIPPGYPGDAVLRTFFGVFGWLDTEIPLWTIIMYTIGLFLALIFQFGRGLFLSAYQKSILAATFILLFVGNITALYLYYTPVGSSFISGVQGRYFIVGSILLLGIFTARKKILDISEKLLAVILGSTMLIVLGMTVIRIFIRYYI